MSRFPTIVLLVLSLLAAAPAAADTFDPKKGRTFVVRDVSGRVVERLHPARDGFVRRDLTGRRLGRVVPGVGGQLSFYDTSGQMIGTAQRGAQPPPALRLQSLAVIRSRTGATLGIVSAR